MEEKRGQDEKAPGRQDFTVLSPYKLRRRTI